MHRRKVSDVMAAKISYTWACKERFLMEQRCLSSCHLRPSESVPPYSSASGHCSGKCSCSLYEALFHRAFLKAQDRTTEDSSERAIPFQDLNLPNPPPMEAIIGLCTSCEYCQHSDALCVPVGLESRTRGQLGSA